MHMQKQAEKNKENNDRGNFIILLNVQGLESHLPSPSINSLGKKPTDN